MIKKRDFKMLSLRFKELAVKIKIKLHFNLHNFDQEGNV